MKRFLFLGIVLLGGLMACKSKTTVSQTTCVEEQHGEWTYVKNKTLEGGSIKGVILDGENRAVPFAHIRLFHADTMVKGGTTNIDGEFSLEAVANTYSLRINAVDFESLKLEEVKISAKKELNIGKIRLINVDENVSYKPILYFYPEEVADIKVQLNYDGELTHTYPSYHNSWEVTAHPNGQLFDQAGKEYYALYWEGKPRQQFHLDEGHVVAGEGTVTFLEEALAIQGLNRREINEFIIYWMPKMENNAYNLIHFSTVEYQGMAKYSITPQPETFIQVMMVYQPLDAPIDIPQQDLEALRKQRKGFTVVEWGGHPISKFNRTY